VVGTTTNRSRSRSSPTKTRAGSCGPFLTRSTRRSLWVGWDSSHGVQRYRPSADKNVVRPLPGGSKPAFRHGGANLYARSVLAVPPDSDGLLRSTLCRSIAPCNRPWGSPCFRDRRCCSTRRLCSRFSSILDGAYPSKLFPPWQLYRVTTVWALSLLVAACPNFPLASPRAFGPFPRLPQPQGFESPVSPLLTSSRCREKVARCSLGLLVPFKAALRGPVDPSGSKEPSVRVRLRRAVGLLHRRVCPRRGLRSGAAGAVFVWAYGAQKSAVGPVGAPAGLRRAFAGAPVGSDAPDPIESASAAPPKRGGLFGPGPVLRSALPKRGGGWPGTSAAGDAVPPRRAGGAGTWHVSAPPKGRGLTSSSRWSGERRRASPSLSTVPLGITLPKMGERFASRGFLSLKNPGRSAEAGLSGLHPLSWRRNAGRVSTGALRGRSVRAEARRCCPGAAVVFPSGPKAFWVPALPKLRWADTRSTEVVRVAAEDGRAEARAFVSFSRAEARGGESPFAGRSPRGRGESLSLSQQQAAGSREGTFPRSQNAPGRRFRSEKKLESIP
jgi:hypothetical protein